MKRILSALICASLVLSGCATVTIRTGAEDPGEESTSSTTVSNDYFEIEIPDELMDIAATDVSSDRIDIYHKESKEAGFGGLIMSIWAVDVPREYAGGPYIKVGELSKENAGEFDLVKGLATEIQWDYNLPDMPDDFKKIDDAANGILDSVKGINGYTYNKGAGTNGADLYGDVLAKYVKAVEEGWDANKLEEEKMSPEFNEIAVSASGNGLDAIGFAYMDVNLDGIDELLIGPVDDQDPQGIIYDIYTMVDRKPESVVSGSARDRYYCDDNFIYNEWSGGADMSGLDMYALTANDTELVYQRGYKYDGYENEEEPWFSSFDGENYDGISEDEYNDGVSEMTGRYLLPGYAPLSDL